MSKLLNVVCIALSIYYVFTAPAYNSTQSRLEEIIDKLLHLEKDPPNDLSLPSLDPDQENKAVPIKELSCKAINSIEAMNSTTQNLKHLLYLLQRFTIGVNCTMLNGQHEETEGVLLFIEHLLKAFRTEYNVLYMSLDKPKQ